MEYIIHPHTFGLPITKMMLDEICHVLTWPVPCCKSPGLFLQMVSQEILTAISASSHYTLFLVKINI